MNLSEFEFAQPFWLWGLLVPLLVTTWARRHRPTYLRVRDYADAHLLPHLLIQNQHQNLNIQRQWQHRIWVLLWFLGILALAGPRWDYQEQEITRPRANLMILLDLSRSMQVKDLPHARLEQGLQEIEELLAEKREIYVGLMVFAGIPHLVAPLTDDYNTLRHLLYELTPDILPLQGSQLNLALQDAARWLQSQPTHDIPHALLISDGEFEADDLQASLELLAKDEFFLHVLGVGSQQGDFIPIEGDTWQKNAAGEVVISRLNEANLRQLAQAGQGIYRYASYRNNDSQAILAQIKASINTEDADKAVQKLWHERFYLLLSVMIILILPWFRRQRGQ
ncbi:MAG: VWA domain-containing protein [Pseudomonadota bacterium]|nr:VWA domain-containing protein [Pseudomonadota bacterium]